MTDESISRAKSDGDRDWICEDAECANVNFARRTSCNRCGKERIDQAAAAALKKQIGIEIGKAAAEKSRGLFSADDWQCTKCGNVNWARRHQCNLCNAPKFGDVEERTGYGGGYNDRGVVEYVSREESDDEYDEFGRKRKRFKGMPKSDEDNEQDENNTKTSKRPPPVTNSQPEPPTVSKPDAKKDDEEDDEEEEEDEEDEDDDDDGDLSKYDLSDWGNEGDDDATAVGEKGKV